MINIKENMFKIGKKEIEFPYSILDVKELNYVYIILLKIPPRVKLGEEELCNVLCYNLEGEFLWRIDSKLPNTIKNPDRLPYIAIDYIDEILTATDFLGRRFEIDKENGKLKTMKVVR